MFAERGEDVDQGQPAGLVEVADGEFVFDFLFLVAGDPQGAAERITGLADAVAGRRNERVRRVIASYYREQ